MAGIAETGPIQPFLSNIDDRNILDAIERETQHLRRADYALRPVAAQPA
jgi:hypothetical protein